MCAGTPRTVDSYHMWPCRICFRVIHATPWPRAHSRRGLAPGLRVRQPNTWRLFFAVLLFRSLPYEVGADQDAVGADPMSRAYLPTLARAPCCMWTAGVSRGRVPLWWSSLSHHVAGVLRVRRCRVEGRATQGVSSTYQPPHFDQWPYAVLFPPWHRLPRYSSLALT
jgi:hypothetical protein